MPQQMRPFEIGVQSGALEGATNHTTNGGLAKAAARGFQADKDLACRTRWTNPTQIANQSSAYIFRQRQSFQSLAFAADENLAALPVQVVQGHGQHFSAAQTEAS